MTRIARSAVFIGYDSLCRKFGLNPLALLRRCGVDPVVLRRPDLYVPYAHLAQALNLAAEESGISNFGLQLSEYHDYLVFGPFGLLLAQAESFTEVLRLTQQYIHLHAQGIALRPKSEDGQLRVEYCLQLPEPVDLRQLRELGLGVVQRSMRTLFGEAWQPSRLLVGHGCMGDAAEYECFFGCPVSFEQSVSAFVTQADIDQLRPLEQRRQLKSHLIEQYAQRHHRQPDLLEQLRYTLQSILPTGDASLEVIARLLGKHPRSLQMELQTQGLSFRSLLEQVRYHEAQEQLRLSAQSITELALNLGYADESAFSRAFKRWSGLSPRQWRQRETS
ncbi:AraC family transcriptional regulator [Pseudomonas sp. PDM16]|uniref:AraC family transcriptional regulator n=1 Tax=Pseudomonas sp. PDM16 TaxID=2769292 RepID=UPI00177B47BC|nr:AraC family transcriptional regulator [Pseudomonas sp. PDM16]MBD9416072.1 AraC family transcriptional regulator [Pseudomonas sp. PDM16]